MKFVKFTQNLLELFWKSGIIRTNEYLGGFLYGKENFNACG